MLRRNACAGLVGSVLIAAGTALSATAQTSGTTGTIVVAPDPCAAPADLPAPTRAGPTDIRGRPVASADVPATGQALGDIPVAIVTDLGTQAGGKPDPRFDTFGYPAALTVQGNRVLMNGRPIAPDSAEADAARRAACGGGSAGR